jgi:hypothetical protein
MGGDRILRRGELPASSVDIGASILAAQSATIYARRQLIRLFSTSDAEILRSNPLYMD